MPINWGQELLKLIPAGIGATSSIIGAKMASKQVNQANQNTQLQSDRLYELGQQEAQRRNALSQLLMPALLKRMGYKNVPGLHGLFNAQVGAGYQQQQASPLTGANPDPGGNNPIDTGYNSRIPPDPSATPIDVSVPPIRPYFQQE